MDLVSIIVPVYNVEKYIDRCIKSIINQTYNNLEIIIVDDGSTDDSGKICDTYIKDDRIKVVHKSNGGLSDARNAGIEIAKGRYICFVDSDDYIDQCFVETLYEIIEKNNVKIAACNYIEFDENGHFKDEILVEEEELFIGQEAIFYLYNNEKYSNFAWNKMYAAELFEQIRYPYGRKMEDLGTTYMLIHKAGGIAYTSKQLYYYYQRSDSILHTPSKEFYIDEYKMTYQRYKDIKNWYPELEKNNQYFINVSMTLYPLLDRNDKNEILQEIKYIWKNDNNSFSFKKKIKYYILCKSERLYTLLFNKIKID